MFRRTILSFVLAAFLVPAVVSAPAPKEGPNLLVNGSFEEGPEGLGNWQVLGAGDKTIKGWEVTRASIDLIGNYWQHGQGNRSLDLHGSPGFGGIKQTFATKPGRRYKVTFALAGNPEGSVAKKKLGVEAAGTTGNSSSTPPGKRPRTWAGRRRRGVSPPRRRRRHWSSTR